MSEEIKSEDKIEDTQENTDISYPEPVGEFEIEDGVLIKGKPDENGICIIPYGVKKIADHSFENCSDLIKITIPDSVTYIARNSFANCSNLTNITMSEIKWTFKDDNDIVYSIYNLLMGTKSENPIIVNDVVVYGRVCNGKVVIQEGVSTIEADAFLDCKTITSVSLPKSLKRIGKNAFAGCTGLEEVISLNETVAIGDDAFRGCTSLKRVNIDFSEHKYAFKDTPLKRRANISETVFTLAASGGVVGCTGMLVQKWNGNAIDSVLLYVFLASVVVLAYILTYTEYGKKEICEAHDIGFIGSLFAGALAILCCSLFFALIIKFWKIIIIILIILIGLGIGFEILGKFIEHFNGS